MAFNISNDQKKQMAQNALEMLQQNLYREILFFGYNPEDFDLEEYRDSDDPTITVGFKSLFDTDAKIKNIQALISSLG